MSTQPFDGPLSKEGGDEGCKILTLYNSYVRDLVPLHNPRLEQNMEVDPISLERFLTEVIRPTLLAHQGNVAFNIPQVNLVDLNTQATIGQIKNVVLTLDQGMVTEGNSVAQLMVLYRHKEETRARFSALSQTSITDLRQSHLSSIAGMQEYMAYFVHPALTHLRNMAGYHHTVMKNQNQLVMEQQQYLQSLYGELTNTISGINQNHNEVIANQNQLVNRLEHVERQLGPYIDEVVRQLVAGFCIEQKWAEGVTDHISRLETFIRSICEETHKIRTLVEKPTIVRNDESLVEELRKVKRTATEAINMTETQSTIINRLEKENIDVWNTNKELTMQLEELRTDSIKNHNDIFNLQCGITPLTQKVDHQASGLRQLRELHKELDSREHDHFQEMDDKQDKQGNMIKDLLESVRNLTIQVRDLTEDLNDRSKTLYSVQEELTSLRKESTRPIVSRAEHRSASRQSIRSYEPNDDFLSFHSYESDEEQFNRPPRFVYTAEPVLDSSNDRVQAEDDIRRSREEASNARFARSNAERAPRDTYTSTESQRNFKPTNLPKFDKNSNVRLFL